MSVKYNSVAFAYELVGRRVEIPPHYDLWMRGARYGKVIEVVKSGADLMARVEMYSVDSPVVRIESSELLGRVLNLS